MAIDKLSRTVGSLRIPPSERGYEQYRLTSQQYLAIIAAGILPDDAVELVGGILIKILWRDERHQHAMKALCDQLQPSLPAHTHHRCFEPIQLGPCTRPRPDIVIASHGPNYYRDRVPRAKEIGLIIEIVDRNYNYARGEKWRRYAHAGIRSYWIVNLPERRVEIYQHPCRGSSIARYNSTQVVSQDAVVPIVIYGVAIGEIPVKKLLLESRN